MSQISSFTGLKLYIVGRNKFKKIFVKAGFTTCMHRFIAPNFVFNRKYDLIHLLIVVVMCSFFCANGGAFDEIRIFKAMVLYATAFKSISLERLTVDRPDLSGYHFTKFRFQQCPGPSDYLILRCLIQASMVSQNLLILRSSKIRISEDFVKNHYLGNR